MFPPPTQAPVLETWLTHLSFTQCCQFYHLNSAHIYPFLYTPTAKALVKALISSYLGYSNGLITDLSASTFVLPIFISIPLLMKLPLTGITSFPVTLSKSPHPSGPPVRPSVKQN